MEKRLFNLSIAFILPWLLTTTGCGNGDDEDTTRRYLGTQAPGDVWSWTISLNNQGKGPFTASNDTKSYSYAGSVAALENKFLELTVVDSNEPGMVLPALAYALEVPNSFLVVKPADNGANVIVGAAQGECPTQAASYNWIRLLDHYWNEDTGEAYGISTSTINGKSYDFTGERYTLSGDLLPNMDDNGFTCDKGKFTTNTTTTIAITPSGAFVADGGPDASGFFGVVAPAGNVDLADAIKAGREFRGVVFEDGSADHDTRPIWARPDGNGNLKGGVYDDFENNIENNEASTLQFGAQDHPGIINGKMVHGGGSNQSDDMVYIVNRIDSRYFIFGASKDSSTGKPYNFIAMEQ